MEGLTMRLALIIAAAMLAWAIPAPQESRADGCVVESSGSYAEGSQIRNDKCDTGGNKKVTLGTLLLVEQGASTTQRFLSTGASDNEFEVCATPCQLLSMSAFSTHTTAVFVKCSEDVIGNVTPGSTAIKFDFGIPGAATGGGNNSANIPPTLGVQLNALTCWIVTDITDAGVATDAPVSTVRVNWAKK